MVRKSKRRGGMFKTAARATGQVLGSIVKETATNYAKKLPNIMTGLAQDPSNASDPRFVLTGKKTTARPNIKIYNNENINPNIQNTSSQPNVTFKYPVGGKTRRRYKKRKTRKNIK